MICDDDARVVRLDGAAFDAHGATDREEDELRGASSQAPPSLHTWHDGQNDAQRNRDDEQRHPGIAAVG